MVAIITSEGPKCPKCNSTAINLVSITDDGKGQRVCRTCKRKIRKENPNKDFRKTGGNKK